MNEYFTVRQECPCCGSNVCDELYRASYCEDPIREYLISFYSPQGKVEFEYLQDQDYVLVECAHCGLVYQREIPNDFLMRKLYEEWIDPKKCFDLYERTRGIRYFKNLGSEIVRIVSIFDQPPMSLKFLDFSMGWGHWCRVAMSFGCTVHGTEFSQARIDYAKSKGVTVIDYSEIANHRYDFINTEQVFEHLPDIRNTINHLKESLKPNGILKINVPDGWDVKKRLKKGDWTAPKGSKDSLNLVAPLEHINCFNHSSLVILARGVGLVPVNTHMKGSISRKSGGFMKTAKAILRPYLRRLKVVKEKSVNRRLYMFFQLANSL
jgi:2-polyprenyl-3-methyl-5-hydroxy-6-metoxy-1,4-benzoquinol methylase